MFKENYIIQGKIVCKTGLHIGGSSDAIDIGGSDNVIIRDPITGNPYIPGSSLKGKLRFLTELNDKDSAQSVINNNGKPADDPNCLSAKLFGISADENQNQLKFPTRTIVRDAYPDEETLELALNLIEACFEAVFKVQAPEQNASGRFVEKYMTDEFGFLKVPFPIPSPLEVFP